LPEEVREVVHGGGDRLVDTWQAEAQLAVGMDVAVRAWRPAAAALPDAGAFVRVVLSELHFDLDGLESAGAGVDVDHSGSERPARPE